MTWKPFNRHLKQFIHKQQWIGYLLFYGRILVRGISQEKMEIIIVVFVKNKWRITWGLWDHRSKSLHQEKEFLSPYRNKEHWQRQWNWKDKESVFTTIQIFKSIQIYSTNHCSNNYQKIIHINWSWKHLNMDLARTLDPITRYRYHRWKDNLQKS